MSEWATDRIEELQADNARLRESDVRLRLALREYVVSTSVTETHFERGFAFFVAHINCHQRAMAIEALRAEEVADAKFASLLPK